MSLYLGENLISGVAYPVEPSRNIGQIIQSTIPLVDAGLHLLDGALISGSGIYSDFVDYIADLYNSSTKYINVNKIGSLTENNGILSGFSSSNYASLPNAFTPGTNTWEMVYKISLANTSIQYDPIAVTPNSPCIALQAYEGKIVLSIGDGTNWIYANAFGNTVLSANTYYYVKLEFTGSAYNVYLSTNGKNYSSEISINNSTVISGLPLNLGLSRNLQSGFSGSIDLNESYINIYNSRWWTGVEVPNFTDENTWQWMVTTYGVCGKFVYNSVNNTVRLPKITGIVEGTTDLTALGDLVEAGLPNINGWFSEGVGTGLTQVDGKLFEREGNIGAATTNSIDYDGERIRFNAQSYNSIYGNSTTVQPQTIKVLYYIVVATSTKTDIQIDIDEIATDLNGKADVDLTNCTKPHIVETYVNGTSWYRVYSDGWCEQGLTKSGDNQEWKSFLKPFADTNYNVQVTATGSSDTTAQEWAYVGAYPLYRETTRVYIRTYSQRNAIAYIYACGYIN